MLSKFAQEISEGILFTDQYQLSMAQLYFRHGLHNKTAQFDHFFRDYPDYGAHKAGYCINAGLEWLIDWMQNTRYTDKDIELLRSQKNTEGKQVFEEDFLNWLKNEGNYENITLQSIPEGRVIHPNTPINVIQGPLASLQIMETALLNQLNYQILVATKASRIKEIGRRKPLLEFGARRAHDRGAAAGARAALIGGADFTSNVGISHVLGYPPKGTHAHSLVQLFLTLGYTEYDAFKAYADMYPDNTILLVDTINTLESGVPNAIKVFEEMRKKGHKPTGIRLDSGDLAFLSVKVAKMLNEAGFEDVKIVLSNELDELNILQIILQIRDEAMKEGLDPENIIDRLIYGVGTRLITSAGASSLGGVYKLVSFKKNNEWEPALKLSETKAKTPNPGNKKLWRIYDNEEKATADILTVDDENPNEMGEIILRHPAEQSKRRKLKREGISKIEPLLVDIMKEGKLVYEFPSIEELKKQRHSDIEKLDSGVRRIINPHVYHVSLSQKLWDLKEGLVSSFKNNHR
jgi:nicotinate phosphoribosyltransferase